MESVNIEVDKKAMDEEHHCPTNEEDHQDNHSDAEQTVRSMEMMTSNDGKPIQLQSKGSSSDIQCEEGMKKFNRRRHSFQSTNYAEQGVTSSGSESPSLLESDSLAPGAYHEGSTFADADLNSLVPADSTPDTHPSLDRHDQEDDLSARSPMAVVHAHVVEEQPFEERFAAEIEARVQAELQDMVEQEVNRTLGAITTAEVVVSNDYDGYGNTTPGDGNDILRTEIVDIDRKEGWPFPGLEKCCSKWRLWVTLLVLMLIGGVVGIIIGKAAASPSSNPFCQMGLHLDGQAAGDGFGFFVALSSDGNCVAISAPQNSGTADGYGYVRIFDWSGSQWVQVGSHLYGKAAGDEFGWSVALSFDGNRVAVGAPYYNGTASGYVSIFDLSGSDWVQVGSDLYGEAEGETFGRSVALSRDGNRVAIGAPNNKGNGDNIGHVRIFDLTGSQWIQVGSNLDGAAGEDQFGRRVALSPDGDRVAIGAPRFGGNGEDSGYVRILDWSGSNWVQLVSDLDGEAAGDQFGWNVALSFDGNRVAIGAPQNSGTADGYGYVRIFDWSGSQWVQVGSDLVGEAAEDQFGKSVALSSDGNRVAIGAPGNSDDIGHVRIFDWSQDQWVHIGADLDGEAIKDYFGNSVALSGEGNRVAIGAIGSDGNNGDSAGGVYLYNISDSSCF